MLSNVEIQTHDSLEDYVRVALASSMPRGRGEIVYRHLPPHLDIPAVSGKRHILFVSYYPDASLIKKSVILRQSGCFYTTLIAACIRDDVDILRWFDSVYEINDYNELYHIISSARVSNVHVASQPWHMGMTAVGASRLAGLPVVVDINDSMLFIKNDSDDEACRIERTMLLNASSFTHKMPDEAIDIMRSVWGIDTPDHAIQSLPLKELCVNHEETENETLSLVFAGGLIPYRIAKSRGFEGHIFTDLIETLCSQDLSLTFYVNQNARDMFWDEQDVYFVYEKRLGNFHFKKGLPFHLLPREMSGFSFGLYYENSSLSSFNKAHYTFNMATKIFSYLEAGLPVLVPDTATYIAEFVQTHGLGMVYRFDDLSNLGDRIKHINRKRLKENVFRFRNRFTMDSQSERLNHVYD